MTEADQTVFETVGGEPFFKALVDRFYDSVAKDPMLAPMYPNDLTNSRTHMTDFLCQYWGGPTKYSDERGHPRLRMRHAGFEIGEAESKAWLGHMLTALKHAELDWVIEDQMNSYFDMAARHMINSDG